MSAVFEAMYGKISSFLQDQEFKKNKRYAVNSMLQYEIRYLEHRYDLDYIVAIGNGDNLKLRVEGDIEVDEFLKDLSRLVAHRGWTPSVNTEIKDHHEFRLNY